MRSKIITTALIGGALAVAVPATAFAAHQSTKTTTITVAMSEFKFKLSKASAPKGKVVFKLSNKGQAAHDFKTATLTVTFQKTGKFPYLCTVPGHAASGMKGTFTIK